MDAVELIKQDHRRIEDLFATFLEAEGEMTQEDLYQQIQTGLNAHAEMEERVLYPAVKQFAEEQVAESLREHAEVKEMLAKLLDADLNEEEFETQFTKLMEDVRHHVEEEESPKGILEIARQNLDEDALSKMAKDLRSIQRGVEKDLAA